MLACVACVSGARVRTVVLRALSVCVVVHVVPVPRVGLPRVGVPAEAGQEPHPNPKGRHVPNTKRPHTPGHHLPLFHRPSRDEVR